MPSIACVILRHDLQPRWIGDLHVAFCHSCGCIHIPELPAERRQPEVTPPASSVAGALRVARPTTGRATA